MELSPCWLRSLGVPDEGLRSLLVSSSSPPNLEAALRNKEGVDRVRSGSVFHLTASVGLCPHVGNQHAVKPCVCTSEYLQNILQGVQQLLHLMTSLAQFLS